MHLAAADGHLDLLKFLIETVGVYLNPKDRWGSTPLNDAKLPEVKEYLESVGALKGLDCNYAEIPNMTCSENQYRLLYAAATNDIPLMKSLHMKGWKVNSYDYDGRSALGLAASNGHVEAIKYLLAHGADPKIKDARGNNALQDAIRENRKEAIDILSSSFN